MKKPIQPGTAYHRATDLTPVAGLQLQGIFMSFAKREPDTKQLQDALQRIVTVAIAREKVAGRYGKKLLTP